MKKLITIVALALSVGAFAQERVVLNAKTVRVNADRAILVRNAQTPSKVEVIFQVPMASSVCIDQRSDYIRQTCHRTEDIYQTRTVCRDVTTTPPSTPSGHTGPRYNPPTTTRRVCSDQRVHVGTRQVPYDCSYTRNWCAQYGTNVNLESDTVKIKFKNTPNLGGTEEDSFQVVAQQRSRDGENVVYDITSIQTVVPYSIEKKGILGYDSYVIEPK
jgi:hypothetical protein